MVISSAPGKLMLFGDHAVVYGYPCLVTAVDIRYQVSLEKIEEPKILIHTPTLEAQGERASITVNDLQGTSLNQTDTNFVVAVLQEMYKRSGYQKGLVLKTYGADNSYGLGSSSAISVATVHAFSNLLLMKYSKDEIFKAAFAAVLRAQKTGSGFDVAAATYGGTVFYKIGEPIEILETGKLPLVIGFTGKKGSTVNLIEKVGQSKKQFPGIIELLIKSIGKVSESAYLALKKNDWETLGKLANINQGLLQSLDISTPSLEKAIYSAKTAGAYGAKLSGAGGGDCMFAITPDLQTNSVRKALTNAGIQVLDFEPNSPGVRLEQKLLV